MIEPLMPNTTAPKEKARAWGTPTPTPTPQPPAVCAFCACSYYFGDSAQNQFSIQVTNGG